jgi:hypothetical protein
MVAGESNALSSTQLIKSFTQKDLMRLVGSLDLPAI